MQWTVILVVLISACSANKLQDAIRSGTTASTPAPAPAPAETASPYESGMENDKPPMVVDVETPTAPAQINGTLLRCVNLLDASGLSVQTTVACRLENAAGERVDDFAVTYKVESVPVEGVTVSMKNPADPNRLYDAILDFKGASAGASLAAAAESTLSATLRDKEKSTVIGTLADRIKNLKGLPQRGLWWRFFGAKGQTFLDQTTGLYWGLDNQAAFTYNEAQLHCDNLEYDNSINWRLPSIEELRIANANNLGKTYAGKEHMNIESQTLPNYWSSSLLAAVPSSLPLPGEGVAQVINLKEKDSVSLQPATISAAVLCVRD